MSNVTRNRKTFVSCIVVCALALLFAEDVAAAGIEEIVVTAEKRPETIQNVPISMSAITGKDLASMGITNSTELSSVVPNLQWLNDGSEVPQIYIRGVGDSSFHLNQQGGVGMYMDGVTLNSPVLRSMPLFDLARVEVLRGPQNTLFGLNTTGGAIQLISRKPKLGEALNGYTSLSYDSLDAFRAQGAVGFAASDTVAVRLAATGTVQSDWKNDVTLNRKIGGYNTYMVRGQVLWQPTQSVSVLFNIHGGQKRGDHAPYPAFGSRYPSNPSVIDPNCAYQVGNGCADSTGYVFPKNWDTVAANLVGADNKDVAGGFMNVKWQLTGVEVTSITGYEHAKSLDYRDSDGGPQNILMFGQVSNTSQWSQEIRLASTSTSPFHWLGGLYYFHEKAHWGTYLRFTPPPVFAASGPANNGPQLVADNVTSQKDDVWSVYGQGKYDLTHSVAFRFGLRYTNENKNAEVADTVGTWTSSLFPADSGMGFSQLALVNAGQAPATANPNKTWQEVGGKATLDYQYSDDMLYYASVARGFKGGGTSLAAIEGITGHPGRTVRPETLWSYELGAKTSWLNRSLQLDAALFYNQWNNEQLFTALVAPGIVGTYLVNIPRTRTYGAEMEMKWRPGAGWYLSGGLTLLNAKVEKAGSQFPALKKGNSLPDAPKVTFDGLVRKDWQLGNGIISLQTSFNYKGAVHYDIAEDPALREGSYWIVNARGSYRFGPDGKYDISVFGRNLGGTQYCMERTTNISSSAFGGSAVCSGNPGVPIVGASASLSF